MAKGTKKGTPVVVRQPALPAAPAPRISIETLPLTLQFLDGRGFFSGAIKDISLGPLSHVDCRLPDGTLIGSRSDTIKLSGGRVCKPGLQIRPADYFTGMARSRTVMTLQVPTTLATSYYTWLLDRIDTPYDRLGIVDIGAKILGIPLRRDWRDESAFFCSEAQGKCGEEVKLYPPLYTPANLLVPVTLATVWSAIGATTQEIPIAA